MRGYIQIRDPGKVGAIRVNLQTDIHGRLSPVVSNPSRVWLRPKDGLEFTRETVQNFYLRT